MSISYFGAGSNPADNGSQNEGAPGSPAACSIVPPASMTVGQLVRILAYTDQNHTVVISDAGGQTWNSLSADGDGTVGGLQYFWCRFNGTWSANPSVIVTTAAYGSISAIMAVFTPTSSANDWGIDVSKTYATYAGPGTPFDVTITGVTAVAADTVTLADWTTINESQWALQTGGWSNPGGATQWRNTDTNLSISTAYKIQTAAGATGNVTNRQTTFTGATGQKVIMTFKEIASGSDNPLAAVKHPRPGKFWR